MIYTITPKKFKGGGAIKMSSNLHFMPSFIIKINNIYVYILMRLIFHMFYKLSLKAFLKYEL